MGSEPVFGCWEWDGEGNCIVNSVTGERLRYMGQALPDASPWQGRFHALRYETEDLACPVIVGVTQALRSARRSALFWRSLESELVTLYQVDFTLSARIADNGATNLPFGVWQRLIEFMPQAILFWPRAWPNVADPANGPGRGDAARCVRTIGAWANGRWRPEIGIEFVIEKPSKLDPTAPYELLDKEKWQLADLAATPASPFLFIDQRAAEDAAADCSPWPDPEGVKHWLAGRGFAVSLPEHTCIEVPASLFDGVPHCRSEDDSRYFFLDRGIELSGTHSPPQGPDYTLVAGAAQFSFRLSSLHDIDKYSASDAEKTNKANGEIIHADSLDKLSECADKITDYYVSTQDTDSDHVTRALTPKGRRLIWQNILDAIVAWQPTQGIYPAKRCRGLLEREAEPGPLIVECPWGNVRMLPLAWVEWDLTGYLGGIYRQIEYSQRPAHHWRSWKSYVILDMGDYSTD